MSGYVVLLVALAVLFGPFVVGHYWARALRMPDYWWKIGIVLLAIAGGLVIACDRWPPRGGIDLVGGVILVYEVDPTKKDPKESVDMDQLIAAVSKRIDPGGVTETTIRQYGPEQIEIIVPGADADQLRRLRKNVSSAGTLEFRILANRRDHADIIETAMATEGKEVVSRRADGTVKDESQVLGWWVPVAEKKEAQFLNDRVVSRPGARKGTLEVLLVNDVYNVTGGYLMQATPSMDERGRPSVDFRFNSEGAKYFGGLTAANLPDETQDFERQLAIVLNGYLQSAPAIRATITTHGTITGDFTQAEVDDLVTVLNAGALPAALTEEPISELLTGPTLGADTIRSGAIAIAMSLISVAIFMALYYRFAGLVACGALLLNLILVVAVMQSINAAFSLPGLAGMVLTVGMSVDANVIIFERIREELQRGAALRMAIRNGFAKAMSAIVDGNLTTLLVAIILYYVGTEQIKGFAVVLFLGIVASMFTAVFCSHVVFDIAEKQRWLTEVRMMKLFDRANVDFVRLMPACVIGSIVVIAIGLVGVVFRGAGLLDIDFTGGVSVEVLFKETQPIADVRAKLEAEVDGKKLDDLVVSDVAARSDAPGRRFRVNTSTNVEGTVGPDGKKLSSTEWVQQHIEKVFGDKLATNALKVEGLKTVEPKPADTPAPEPAAAQPSADKQSRRIPAAVPPWASLLLGQNEPAAAPETPATPEGAAEPAAPAPAEEKPAAEAPASETPAEEKPAAEQPAEEKPAAETPAAAAPTPETPAPAPAAAAPAPETPAAETPAAEPPAAAPAPETPVAPPAAPAAPAAEEAKTVETEATVVFAEPVDQETVESLVREQLEADPELPDDAVVEAKSVKEKTSWAVTVGLAPEQAKKVFERINANLTKEPFFPSSTTIGSRVAGAAQAQAFYAVLASLIGIILYVWVRFERVTYGLAGVLALVHDTLFTLGFLALSYWLAPVLGWLMVDPFKIGLTVLAAFLTIIGYSINDTIIVFDRIREIRGKAPHVTKEIINTGINQTLSRTVLTSGTTLLTVFVLYVGGGPTIHAFAFALLVGIGIGTYSSIFIAAPILLWMTPPQAREGEGRWQGRVSDR